MGSRLGLLLFGLGMKVLAFPKGTKHVLLLCDVFVEPLNCSASS